MALALIREDGNLSRRIHAEGAKSAKSAEKTSKEAAAHAIPAARASREKEGYEIPETSSALKLPLFVSAIS
jgi:IMP cyclohydrolase